MTVIKQIIVRISSVARPLRLLMTLGLLFLCLSARAEVASLETAGAGARDLVYVSLGPSFVTNYDGGGRLKYLKVDVSVRVRPPADGAVERHLPYIRNRLVALFASQLEENLTSTEDKEKLRFQSLEIVRQALNGLEREGIGSQVVNLYFTSFVVQR